MNDGPKVIGNPLRVSVYLLVAAYIVGEFIFPKYEIAYLFQLVGILGLILSVIIFFSGFKIFKTYDEDPVPTSTTNRIIKTGIFAYSRNPIYLSFVMFHLGMFLVFENVAYFLSGSGIAIWLHFYVIKMEEKYLLETFPEEFERYMGAVKRWLFF